MKKIAFLFPGQGSQYVGMAKDLHDEYPEIKILFSTAGDILKCDLAKICFEDPAEVLVQTRYTQPAIYVHSMALWLVLNQQNIKPAFVAGHSLGEYSALVAAKALSFETGLETVKNRSLLMQEACEKSDGTMAAIVGLSEKDVIFICQETKIQPANFNSKDQVVVSGKRKGVEKAVELAIEKGAKRAILLKVAGAYHSELMNSAKGQFEQIINRINIEKPIVPVIANVNAKPVSDPEQIKQLLINQVTMPVLWYQSMKYLYEQGVRIFVEVGPGKVLQGLLKRSFEDISLHGIDKPSELGKFIENYQTGNV